MNETEENEFQPEGGYLSTPDMQEFGSAKQLANLYSALASARLEFEKVEKGREVNAGSYTFDYATLDHFIEKTAPALSKHGLVVLMPFGGNFGELATQRLILAHKDGGRLVFSCSFVPLRDIKLFGGQTTYMQRYMYRSVLGLGGGADIDDMPTENNDNRPVQARDKQAPKQERPQPTRQPQAQPAPQAAQKPKASAEDLAATKALLRELGYNDADKAKRRIFEALGGRIVEIGNPFGSAIEVADLDVVRMSLMTEKAKL